MLCFFEQSQCTAGVLFFCISESPYAALQRKSPGLMTAETAEDAGICTGLRMFRHPPGWKGRVKMILKEPMAFGSDGAVRMLHIWLPEDYHRSGERYPVMYFFDGHNLYLDSDATFGKSWGMAEFLSGWDKPIIMVGMECAHEGNDRLSEYSPFPVRWGSGQIAPRGEETFRWILEKVKPAVDASFRTIPFRECTAIGGSSMGGLMAVYGVTHYNRWFSKAACVSSAIGMCAPPLYRDIDRCSIDADTRVFLSWGTREARGVKDEHAVDRSSATYRNNRAVANKLNRSGACVRLLCQVEGGHCEADWEKQIPLFMPFLWQNRDEGLME